MRIKPNLCERARAGDPDCIPELIQLLTTAALEFLKLESTHPRLIEKEREQLKEWVRLSNRAEELNAKVIVV